MPLVCPRGSALRAVVGCLRGGVVAVCGTPCKRAFEGMSFFLAPFRERSFWHPEQKLLYSVCVCVRRGRMACFAFAEAKIGQKKSRSRSINV